jgi:hypothetical protein
MVKKFPDMFGRDELAWLKKDMDEKMLLDSCVEREFNAADAKRLFGVDDWTVHDRRYILSGRDEAWNVVAPKIYKIVPQGTELYIAYQRQYLPHLLHVDEVHDSTDMDNAYSAIIPLDENRDGIMKTVVWNKYCPRYSDFREFFMDFVQNPGKYPRVSNVSQEQDVDHVRSGDPDICDAMEFDGVYEYELGSIGMFDRTHVHCSSNWRKYGIWDYKDIIILHIG